MKKLGTFEITLNSHEDDSKIKHEITVTPKVIYEVFEHFTVIDLQMATETVDLGRLGKLIAIVTGDENAAYQFVSTPINDCFEPILNLIQMIMGGGAKGDKGKKPQKTQK